MERTSIDNIKAKKATAMLERVINLNNNAQPDISYSLEFNGCTKGVYFTKMRKTDCTFNTIFNVYAYLDDNDLGYPASAVEAVIAEEERSQKEEQK